jgi:predicted alpha/beta-hydrolase family hydrolase
VREAEVELAGHRALIVRPRGAFAALVLAHGAGAGMRSSLLARIAHELAAREIATARWEFPYMTAGKKLPPRGGDFEASVRAVWSAARRRFRALPTFAGGRSFGGRMTSQAHAASPLPGCRGIAFLGFPLHPAGKPGVARAEHLARATGPLHFLQGMHDELADAKLLEREVGKLGDRAELMMYAAATHDFPAAVHEPMADAIAAWMSRILC